MYWPASEQEEIAEREAAVAAAEANLKLAQQEYDRTKQLNERDFASLQKLQQATASLDVAAKLARTSQIRVRRGKSGRDARATRGGARQRRHR